MSSIGRRFPSWAKPSKITAITGVVTGLAELIFTPIPNGSGGNDSWLQRIQAGYTAYQASHNPFDLLATDSDGNNAITIATYQLKQNAPQAIGTVAGFGVTAAILAYFGL